MSQFQNFDSLSFENKVTDEIAELLFLLKQKETIENYFPDLQIPLEVQEKRIQSFEIYHEFESTKKLKYQHCHHFKSWGI